MISAQWRMFFFSWACLGLQMIPSFASTSVSTVPAGFFSVTIAPGSGSSAFVSFISFPLQATASAAGQMTGLVTSVTSNTISCSGAGWTAGQLSQPATPYLIQFISGAAAGRFFLISTDSSSVNTSTTVTLDSSDATITDLTTLGIAPNVDTYQIIPADTISSLFGTPAQTGVLGGTNSTGVDQIQLFSPVSGWSYYYYNTNSGWTRIGPPIPSGNTVIRPDTGIIYARYGTTPITLTLVGRVPSVAKQAVVMNRATTVLSNYWPTDITLAGANISQLSGWVSAASYTTADLVQIYSPTNGWRQYFYNGTHWIQVGPPIVSDATVIPAGTAVMIAKRGNASGQAILSQPLPYTF